MTPQHGRCGRHVRDRGSATIWVVGLLSLIVLATVAGTARGAAVVSRHRAETAADLAALAAAGKVVDDLEAACQAASEIASSNGARLDSCSPDGMVVTVSVSSPLHIPGLGWFVARARARAGPAEPIPMEVVRR